ncbi:hypothetical protein MMC07_004379 [Pseudocyphellaria aurata]|nr:hypothetical protein [Pseudocyphellaria aurata]
MPMSSDVELKKRQRKDYGFHLEYRTRWQDNDMYGHMNNGVHYHLFDSIINAYLIQHCALKPSESPSIGLVVHSQCNYYGSVTFPAMLDLGLRVSKLGKASATYEVGVFERGKEDVRAVGGYTHVFVEIGTRKPALGGMSVETRKGLEKLLPPSKPKI